MDKNNTEQCSSPAGDSSSGALETSQQRADSMGDDGSFFGGRLVYYFCGVFKNLTKIIL